MGYYMISRNQQLFERSQKYIPGGVNSPVRAFKSVGGTPVFFRRGKGAQVYGMQMIKPILIMWGRGVR